MSFESSLVKPPFRKPLSVPFHGVEKTHVGLVVNIENLEIKKGNKNSDSTTRRG